MELLIVGGTSSIGNYLLKKLSKSKEIRVTSTFSNSKPQIMSNNIDWVQLKFNFETNNLITEVKKHNFDYIIHLNGFDQNKFSIEKNSNVYDYWNNIKNYFDYFSGNFVNISSNAVYQPSNFNLNEESKLNLKTNYSLQKIYCETSHFNQMNLRGAFFPLSTLGTGKLPKKIYYAPHKHALSIPRNLKWNGVTSSNLAEIILNIISLNLFRVGNFNIFSRGSIDYFDYVKALLFFYNRKDIELNIYDSDSNQNLILNTLYGDFNEKLWGIENFNKVPLAIEIVDSIKKTKFHLQ